jgi:hypothetical protein
MPNAPAKIHEVGESPGATPQHRLVPSTEVLQRLEDTLTRAAKAAFARAPLAATTMAEPQEASPHAAARASVAAADPAVALVGDDDQVLS